MGAPERTSAGHGGTGGDRNMTEHPFLGRIRSSDLVGRVGRVQRILPTYIESDGPSVPLGTLCRIEVAREQGDAGTCSILAEVVSVNTGSIVLVPFEDKVRTFAGALVEACQDADHAPVGDSLLGRAVDPLGRPIDGKGIVRGTSFSSRVRTVTPPLDRAPPRRVFETGIRAIDAFLTLGEGQRVGIFAASGVGKTSLMGQLARQAKADRCVICLVGERAGKGGAGCGDVGPGCRLACPCRRLCVGHRRPLARTGSPCNAASRLGDSAGHGHAGNGLGCRRTADLESLYA